MTFPSSSLLDAALYYAELGYPVFPLVPNAKVPATEHGFKDATTDADQIELWWAAQPSANIGIPMEGRLVIDIDGAQNPWPGDPLKTLDLAQCPVSLTPHGGSHHIFRQPAGKSFGNTMSKLAPMVDTRANGGYIVAPPSVVDGKPYEWAPSMELEIAPDALPEPPAWVVLALEALEQPAPVPVTGNGNGARVHLPADGNPIPKGHRHKMLVAIAGVMRRVGMTSQEMLGALLQVNSARCVPPKSSREVLHIAESVAKYEPNQLAVAVVEDHFGQDAAFGRSDVKDPGLLPESLLRIPGFVSEVMDYTLKTAPQPNVPMAFAGALALIATLTGRKIRDAGDNRTNVYLLALAYSAAGKDRPRKVNTEILHACGMSSHIRGRIGSGEGVEDNLLINPCLLYQVDEIDTMLQAMNRARDGRHEALMAALLTFYSSASSIVPMRSKAGQTTPSVIDQPCLVLFGSAIPNHYYDALSERMLTNGFFARTLVIECGKRGPSQEPRILPIPPSIILAADYWASYRPPGSGNLGIEHPQPTIVEHSAEASAILNETRLAADAEYAKAEDKGDTVGTTVWGRVSENVRKLALLYAASENREALEIGAGAVRWARDFVLHQTQRMLFMAQNRAAETEFQQQCVKMLDALAKAEGRELGHSTLLRKMRVEAGAFQKVVQTLQQTGQLVVRDQSTKGRPGRCYALPEGRA